LIQDHPWIENPPMLALKQFRNLTSLTNFTAAHRIKEAAKWCEFDAAMVSETPI